VTEHDYAPGFLILGAMLETIYNVLWSLFPMLGPGVYM